MLTTLSGCSLLQLVSTEGCNFQTYTNTGILNYISARYYSSQPVRMAIIPFNVPENFAPPGNESLHYGRTLARKFQSELLRSKSASIIELFNRDRWPGKREEFFAGNAKAIQFAREAGYDLVLVGYMEDLKGDEALTINTKIIDTSNGVTIWFAKTTVFTRDRSIREALSRTRMFRDRPELFAFSELTDELTSCTVNEILTADPLEG